MTDTCGIEVERMEVQEVLPNSAVKVVTNCSSTHLEVGGSVGISDAEERGVESRRASSAIEESAQEETKRRCDVEKTVAWKIFKTTVFAICLVFLVIQSVEFLREYYKYPTKIETEITVATEVKLPAVTLCFRNTMSYPTFCSSKPTRCKSPSNIEEFCRKRPYGSDCRRNKSNVKVPIQDWRTRKIMQTNLLNDSYNDAVLFSDYNYSSKARTFVSDFEKYGLFLKCYSENLHLYQSGSKPETMKLQFDYDEGDLVSFILLDQVEIEPFYPKDEAQVFVAIHSPYLPIDPNNLHAIMPDIGYNIDVQLEKEEHLLPPPYQTDCRDNGPSKDAKEFTNPNSHQMCLNLCRSEYAKAVSGCDWALAMSPSPSGSCHRFSKRPDLSKEQIAELRDKRLFCFQNCKQGCLKLHYKTTIKENDLRDDPDDRFKSIIQISVKNPEVTVLQHVPLYGSGDVFSHIGALLGCWLGVSVFTFTDILEKFFRKVVKWKRRFRKRKFTLKRFRKRRFTLRRFRKRKVQRAPQTSEIHQD